MFSMQQMLRSLEIGHQVPLLANNPPNTLCYSDKPPMLGGIPRRISIHEFMQIYTANGGEPFEYTETVWFTSILKQIKGFVDPEKKYEEYRSKFESFLYEPKQLTDRLMISFINPEVGFGVFANEDIPALTMIGVYSGVLTSFNTSPYVLGDLNIDLSVDAKLKGGMTRFFQHMPISLPQYYKNYCAFKEKKDPDHFFIAGFAKSILSKPLLSFENFVDGYKKYPGTGSFLLNEPPAEVKIASANIGHEFYIMDGLPLFVFYSKQKINRYEQLGFDYGSQYWQQHGKSPYLFNMQGETIGTGNTCQNCGHIALKLLKCSICKQAYYCDAQCQKEDWKEHKKQCKK